MRDRIKPATKAKFKKAVRDVVKSLGRPVLVYKTPIRSECFNCFYDKLTDRSTGKCRWSIFQANVKQTEYESKGGTDIRYQYFYHGRCPVCFGNGFLETHVTEWVKCLVIWEPSRQGYNSVYSYVPAGKEDSVVVELKTEPKYDSVFRNCLKIVVDDIECVMSKPPVRRGLGNNSLLIVRAYTNKMVTIDRGSVRKTYR